MFYRFTVILLLFCAAVLTVGCHVLFTEQEWSENYALMEGVYSTSPQMIDGNLNTVGETQSPTSQGMRYRMDAGTEVIIKLPEKKNIRRIVIHSDNIKKLNLYADKGGTALSKTDWQLVKEIKSAKSNPIVIPVLYAFATDQIRIVVLDTTDDAALARKDRAQFYSNPLSIQSGRFGGGRFRYSYAAKINEIEIYGYKSVTETTAADSETKREDELDAILE